MAKNKRFLQEFCHDPAEDTQLKEPLRQFRHYRLAQQLSIAESKVPRPDRNANALSLESRNFVPCYRLTGEENEPETSESHEFCLDSEGKSPCQLSEEESHTPSHAKCRDFFSTDVTDTELVECCLQADEMLPSPSNTTQDRTSLVNSILEDFCLSPLRPSQIVKTSLLENSPPFTFKKKPTKTYSCRRRPIFNKRIEFGSKESLESSSTLSVEEYVSQDNPVCSALVIPNNSQVICENLLNLSAYYNQECRESEESLESSIFDRMEQACDRVNELINEIIFIRKQRDDSFDTHNPSSDESDDCIGFPSNSQVPLQQHNETVVYGLDETLLSPDELLRPADIIADDGDSMSHHMSDEKAAISEDDSTMSKTALTNNAFDEWDNDFTEIFGLVKTPPHCKKTTKIQEKWEQSSNRGVINGTKLPKAALFGKPATITVENHMRADTYLKSDIEHNKMGFKTAKGQAIVPSAEALSKIQNFVSQFGSIQEQDEESNLLALKTSLHRKSRVESKTKINPDNDHQSNVRSDTASTMHTEAEGLIDTVGFRTARGKNIMPSANAIRSIEKLLNDFSSCDANADGAKQLYAMKQEIYEKKSKQCQMVQDRNEDFDLENVVLSEWPLSDSEPVGTTVPQALGGETIVAGFCTAGGKKVSISEEAKKTAERLLKSVENESYAFIGCEGVNAQLRAEPCTSSNLNVSVNEIVETAHLPYNSPNESQKRINDTVEEEESNTPAAKSIISRRNLLSLSKKRKRSRGLSPSTDKNSICASLDSETTINSPLAAKTPIKSTSYTSNAKRMHTSSTPNMVDCARNAITSSTPTVSSVCRANSELSPSAVSTPLKPSTSDRIERLKAYGEPPAISPIPTRLQRNCRSSGLRPVRSMSKKSDTKT